MKAMPSSVWRVYRRLLRYARPYAGVLTIGILAGILAGVGAGATSDGVGQRGFNSSIQVEQERIAPFNGTCRHRQCWLRTGSARRLGTLPLSAA